MFCPRCHEQSNDADWLLNDDEGNIILLGDLEESSDWDLYEVAICPVCDQMSYIDKIAEFNA